MLVRLPDGAAGDEKTQQKLLKLVEDGAAARRTSLGRGWVREVLGGAARTVEALDPLYQPIRKGPVRRFG